MKIDPDQFQINAERLEKAGYDISLLEINGFVSNHNTEWLVNNKEYYDNFLCWWGRNDEISEITNERLEIELLCINEDINSYKNHRHTSQMDATKRMKHCENGIKIAEISLQSFRNKI